jgi:hypothetical protein
MKTQRKILVPARNQNPTMLSLASCFTDCATLTHLDLTVIIKYLKTDLDDASEDGNFRELN